MSVYVFTGPTLTANDGESVLDAVYLPPAAHGDIYRVALRKPQVICIVDGYFERVPAVWHKEILWAMSRGIHVLGGGSLGALRAAELAAFGMEGVGAIFDWYCSGVIDADDEVAVVHGSRSDNYRPLSEALVNIRATMARAVSEGIVADVTASALLTGAAALFYPDRSYPRLLADGEAAGLPRDQLVGLREWLPQGRVDQKRDDALEMLHTIRNHLDGGLPRKRVSFVFEHTVFWENALLAQAIAPTDGEGDTPDVDRLFDELRLEWNAYNRACRGALLYVLALAEAQRLRLEPSAEQIEQMGSSFRLQHGLAEPSRFELWLEENQITVEGFAELMRDEVLLMMVRSRYRTQTLLRLPDHLRVLDRYRHLRARSRSKHAALDHQGLGAAGLAETGLTVDELLGWYARRTGRAAPSDIEQLTEQLGYENPGSLLTALVREHLFTETSVGEVDQFPS